MCQESAVQGWDIVLYGDSQLETLRGTASGRLVSRAHGVHKVWMRHLGHFKSMNMAISGVTT